MKNKELHPHLLRLIQNHFSERDVWSDTQLNKFLKTINNTYKDYERDFKLFERANALNDEEYNKINQKLKEELNNNKKFQLKLLKAKNKAEKANESKTNFLSVMSHEIRTPLNAIIGSIYLLEKNNDLNQLNEQIDILKVSSNNLLSLINDILDYNKIDAKKAYLEQIPFNLKQILDDIIKSQDFNFKSNQNKVIYNIDEKLNYHLIGDPLRLSQILINLISNASKFSKQEKITITVKEIEKKSESATIYFEIKDTGIGIKQSNLKKIFQPFTQEQNNTTRKFGGTGLGLVIVSQLLKLHNSKINVYSKRKTGSTFFFEITFALSNSSIKTEDKIENTNFNFSKILIVEDNLINIKILGKILNNWKIDYDIAENGKIGFEKFQKNHYDLILMDLSMPVMDGFESTILIRKINNTIPIIAVSASDFVNDISKAKALGFTDYITKPFNMVNLNSKLNNYL